MKNLLLGTAAIAGLVLASAPAAAQMELTIGGHSKNYVGWLDQDGTDSNEFDMIRETELHFNGESTLDNGLTFGFQVETEVDGGDDSNTIEESYIYLSSGFGRLNLGSEDGAAYLLQIAAPSADSNIDGIRQYITPLAVDAVDIDGDTVDDINLTDALVIRDYAHDYTGQEEKITYLSPNYGGFQFGGSYTHDVEDEAARLNQGVGGFNGFNEDRDADENGAGYEAALRYEGAASNMGYAFGAGYSNVENAGDNQEVWNVGLDVDAGAFGIGAVYGELEDDALEGDTLVVGVDYTTGPVKLGASYLMGEQEDGVLSAETDRYTAGVVYTAGPGLSFRGSVSHSELELSNATASADADATAVLGGVQINF